MSHAHQESEKPQAESPPLSRVATVMKSQLPPIVTTLERNATLEHKHDESEPTPTDLWGPALGRNPRSCEDPIVRAYRLAIGILHALRSTVEPGKLEEGCGAVHSLPPLKERRSNAVGLYQLVLKSQRRKDILHGVLDMTLYPL